MQDRLLVVKLQPFSSFSLLRLLLPQWYTYASGADNSTDSPARCPHPNCSCRRDDGLSRVLPPAARNWTWGLNVRNLSACRFANFEHDCCHFSHHRRTSEDAVANERVIFLSRVVGAWARHNPDG
jgi:hypothetical protein